MINMIVQYVGAVIDTHKRGDLISEGKEEGIRKTSRGYFHTGFLKTSFLRF